MMKHLRNIDDLYRKLIYYAVNLLIRKAMEKHCSENVHQAERRGLYQFSYRTFFTYRTFEFHGRCCRTDGGVEASALR